MYDKRLDAPYWALRIVFGVVPLVAGLDKFFNLLTNWEAYLSPFAARMLPVSPYTFMRGVGVVEIIVGVGVLSGLTRVFSAIAGVWLAAIAVNLLTTGRYFDIAARDVGLCIAAFSLSRLAAIREGVKEPAAPRTVVVGRPIESGI